MKFKCENFFDAHAILFYALCALLGFYGTYLAPLLILASFKRFLPGLLLITSAFFYGQTLSMESEHILFKPSSIKEEQTHFGNSWLYTGYLMNGMPHTARYRGNSRPKGDQIYLLRGKEWIPIKQILPIAEWRLSCKQKVKKWIHKNFSNKRCAEFLSGITTGDFQDRLMKLEFSKTGLQHIMAISGFHFALVTAFLAFLMRMLLPQKLAMAILLFGLLLYFLFLGPTPSIIRACVMCVAIVVSFLSGKTSTALNALGIAVLAVLIWDPYMTLGAGFGLSFVITGSILLFTPTVKGWLDFVIKERRMYEVKGLSLSDQHAYLMLWLVKGLLSLTIAVNITAIPLTLYYFGKFPVLGLVFNLFVPLITSLVMLFFLLSVLFCWVPVLGWMLIEMTQGVTHFMMGLIYGVPSGFVGYVNYELGREIFVGYLVVIFLAGILSWSRRNGELLYI